MGGATSTTPHDDEAPLMFDEAHQESTSAQSQEVEGPVHIRRPFASPYRFVRTSRVTPSRCSSAMLEVGGGVKSRKRRQSGSRTRSETAAALRNADWPDGGDSSNADMRKFDTPPLLTAALTIVLLSDWAPTKTVKRLQLASVAICGACRETAGFHVRVTRRTPRRLWTTRKPARKRPGQDGGATAITVSPAVPGVRAERLTFSDNYARAVDAVLWPSRLKRVTFGKEFNQPVEGVAWPEGLRTLEFGYEFDQPIEAVAFPPGLRTLRFGVRFNQDVSGVAWSPGLKHLAFGCQFEQTLEHTRLPRGLVTLEFGCRWNSPLEPIAFPDSLETLRLGDGFNQPVDGVRWPTGLAHLSLGDSFDQSLAGVILPCGLRSIEIGDGFDRPLEGVRWPAGLERAAFGASMSTCFAMLVEWPSSMVELRIGSIVLKRVSIFFVKRPTTEAHP